MAKKKGPSMEVLERLSKPVKKAEPKDMYQECSFSPKLCKKSLELTASREKFHDRIEGVIKNHRESMEARIKAKPAFTFKPTITENKDLEAKLQGRGDFFKRAADDIANRKKNRESMDKRATEGFTFQPTVTKAKGIGESIQGSFLERVGKDIDKRKSNDKSEKKDEECTFQPAISQHSQKLMKEKGGGKFMGRMNEDLEKRRTKEAETKKALAKPPKFKKPGKK